MAPGNLQKLAGSNYLCDNGQIWLDSKGRIWTFNLENAIICVDINGSGNPNRYNIDIFAFIPMSSKMVAKWLYNDEDNPNNYAGQIVLCNADALHTDNLGNTRPTWREQQKNIQMQNLHLITVLLTSLSIILHLQGNQLKAKM